VPSKADDDEWKILSQVNQASWHPWNPQKFEIRKLVRSFFLQKYWPKNHIPVSDIVCHDPFFTSLYHTEVVASPEELATLQESSLSLEEKELEIKILKREERETVLVITAEELQ
jgi:hypothetical protein